MIREFIMGLHGEPKGWDRSGQNGKFHYDTKKNSDMKAAIRVLAQNNAEKQGIQLPIPSGDRGYAIYIETTFIPSKSTSKKNLSLMREGKIRPKVKPDIDNIAKLWLDALVKGGIIEDDKNVVRLVVSKVYGETEMTICKVYWDEPEKPEVIDG